MITRAPRISKKKQDGLLKCFVLDVPASTASYHYHKRADGTKKKIDGIVDVSRPTANHYYRHFRELIYTSLRRAPRFSGEVEMDQTEFGGMGSKRLRAYLTRIKKTLPYAEYQAKAKLARAEHKIKVFGILQREGQVYVKIIRQADKRTLMPIIRMVVEESATIYTDKWRGFADLEIDGYTHHSINHSEEYIDKQGHHANTIESFWSFAKRRLVKFNGVARTTLPLHLKECEWRYNQKDIAKSLKQLLKNHQVNLRPPRPRQKSTGKKSRRRPSPSRRKSRTGNDRASLPASAS